ncbi:hypothetical protein GC425_07910 [Corynebacterium sp. zg254]|uniref:Immunity repressor n=1 Tax=Corynebacterium zhongnanshanii TaxID=2768834 RepID=A0ABQ6VC72_9CORY|nr:MULTISPECIES: hypothetical protein [Corynebacterium]KAB1550744.1 hypothetical protein F7233_09460 [Corynebacterium sp. 321]KAB3519839.1 hypothetical protein F8377_07950 [Corynebacterium zhongnanshanii]MCR5914773.1 hypothetical protein [Corynebacterium sp. zg254]
MSGLTPELVVALMNSGYSQTAIGVEYGVSRQYVHQLALKAGHSPVIQKVKDIFPWDVSSEYYDNTVYQGLKLLGHYRLGGEGSINGSSKKKVNSILKKIVVFHQVIDFDPSYPAIPGITNGPGFAYVPRTEKDEDFVVKIRPGTKIVGEGDRIWRIPEVWP